MRPALPSGSANLRIIFLIAQGVSVTGFPADVTAPSRMRGDGTRFASTPAACRTKVAGISSGIWARHDRQPQPGNRRPESRRPGLRRPLAEDRQPRLARRHAHRRQLHRRLRRHAAAPPPQRAADAARQGRVRRPGRHLAADRAVRPHDIKATIFTLGRICELYPQALKAARQKRARDRRPHVGAPRAEGAGARARPSAARPQPRWRGSAAAAPSARAAGTRPRCCGRRATSTTPTARADHRPYYVLRRQGRALPARPAVPLRHRRRHVLLLRLVRVAPTASSASPTPTACSTCGGRPSCSSTAQGGYLNICLHPFVSGRALRIAMLDRLIARMKALPGVWLPTCEEVARHCLDEHPPKRAGVRAEESAPCPGRTRYTISDERSLADARYPLARGQALRRPHRRRPERRQRARGHHGARTSTAAGRSSARTRGSISCWRRSSRHGLRATFAVPAVTAEIDPAQDQGARRARARDRRARLQARGCERARPRGGEGAPRPARRRS